MAFNDAGPIVTLLPLALGGQPLRWTYSFGLRDAGAQFAAADVKTRGGILVAFNQAKRILPNGGVVYSVDIRNDGAASVGLNLQGGGFSPGFNNIGAVLTLVPDGPPGFPPPPKALFQFGSPMEIGQRDQGAQFFGADIKSRDCEVVVLSEGKEIVPGRGVVYSVVLKNNGPATAAYNFQGGGLANNGFNNVGDLMTIEPGEPQLYHFFFGLGREDRGAQYASADVHTQGAELVALSHGKEKGVFGTDYYVTIRNVGAVTAAYNVQGGGLS